MNLWSEGLWDTSDVEAERKRDRLVTARAATASVWPFLTAASDREDFANRLELVSHRFNAAAEGDTDLAIRLQAAYVADFETLLRARASAQHETGELHYTKCGSEISGKKASLLDDLDAGPVRVPHSHQDLIDHVVHGHGGVFDANDINADRKVASGMPEETLRNIHNFSLHPTRSHSHVGSGELWSSSLGKYVSAQNEPEAPKPQVFSSTQPIQHRTARSDDIVGYTYKADEYHPHCLIEDMVRNGDLSPAARDLHPEEVLDQHAGANGIDRYNERSYDSSEHPKVIFRDQSGDSRCGACGESLNDSWMPHRANLQVEAATYAEEQAAIAKARPFTHIYNPIGWDQWDSRPHPGSSVIAPDSKVKYHGYMSPRGPGGMRLVHIEDENGNHQTVDSRSISKIQGAKDPNPPKDSFRRANFQREALVNTARRRMYRGQPACPLCNSGPDTEEHFRDSHAEEPDNGPKYNRPELGNNYTYWGDYDEAGNAVGTGTGRSARKPKAASRREMAVKKFYGFLEEEDTTSGIEATAAAEVSPKEVEGALQVVQAAVRDAKSNQFEDEYDAGLPCKVAACDQSFYSEEERTEHLKTVHAATVTQSATQPAKSRTRRLFPRRDKDGENLKKKCPICNKEIPVSEMAAHIKKEHPHEAIKPEDEKRGEEAEAKKRQTQERKEKYASAEHKEHEEGMRVTAADDFSTSTADNPFIPSGGVEAPPVPGTGIPGTMNSMPTPGTMNSMPTPGVDTAAMTPMQDLNLPSNMNPRAAHKVAVIAADLQYLNPGIKPEQAFRLAKATLARYPSIAVEARGGADWIDGEQVTECAQCGKNAFSPASKHCHFCGYVSAA